MRLPVKQPVKLPTKLHPKWGEYIKRRSFRFNAGTIDYVGLAQPVGLAADFKISWTGQVPAAGGHLFSKFSTPPANRLALNTVGGLVVLNISGGTAFDGSISGISGIRGDGKVHRFDLSRSNDNLTLSIDGVGYPMGTGSGEFVIDRFMSKWSATTGIPNYAGVMADVMIESAGTLIHHWPMNEGSGSTHVDTIGGNNGTIINGQASDWELFERLPGSVEWVGQELVTNGGFDSGTTGWTANNATLSVVNGELEVTSAGSSPSARQSFYANAGAVRVALDFRKGTAPNTQLMRVGSTPGANNYANISYPATGKYESAISIPTSGITYIAVGFGETAAGQTSYWDNLSIRRILEEA